METFDGEAIAGGTFAGGTFDGEAFDVATFPAKNGFKFLNASGAPFTGGAVDLFARVVN